MGFGDKNLVVLTFFIIAVLAVGLFLWWFYRVTIIHPIQHQNYTNGNVPNGLLEMQQLKVDSNDGNNYEAQELASDERENESVHKISVHLHSLLEHLRIHNIRRSFSLPDLRRLPSSKNTSVHYGLGVHVNCSESDTDVTTPSDFILIENDIHP